MYTKDTREQIMYDWHIKGVSCYNEGNQFEAFIYLWISLVVACKVHLAHNIAYNKYVQKDLEDSKVIIDWAKNNSSRVVKIITDNQSSLACLGTRVGSQYKNPIIDSSERLQKKFQKLSRHFKGHDIYSTEDDLAVDFIELINKIRNNLFHGNKSYEKKEDQELLAAILPSLKDITSIAVEIY